MLTGERHAVQLAVSLRSLRQHWSGPVAIIAGDDDAKRFAARAAMDPNIDVDRIKWTAPTGRRGQGYANKCKMFQLSPYKHTIFLDADTLVVDRLDGLWSDDAAQVVLTQFSDWVSNGSRIRKRFGPWENVEPLRVAQQREAAYPAINTGVIAFGHCCGAFFEHWEEVTNRNIRFICDEIAAQLIFDEHHTKVVDDRWNCSPVHGANRDGVHIWHGHGWKFIKRHVGREIWMPYFREAYEADTCGIQTWYPAGDRKLAAMMNGSEAYGASLGEQIGLRDWANKWIHTSRTRG